MGSDGETLQFSGREPRWRGDARNEGHHWLMLAIGLAGFSQEIAKTCPKIRFTSPPTKTKWFGKIMIDNPLQVPKIEVS